MKSTFSFLIDHGLTLLTGTFAGAAIALASSNVEAINFWGWSLLFLSTCAFIFRRFLGKAQSKLSKTIRLLSRIIASRLLRTMPRKSEPKLRIEYLPVALLFFMFGIGLVASWEWEFWHVTSSIGSLLAGTGTVGLLWFGWTKANDWIHQKKSDLIVSECIRAGRLGYSLIDFYDNEVVSKVIKLALELETFIKNTEELNKIRRDVAIKAEFTRISALQNECINRFSSKLTQTGGTITTLALLAPNYVMPEELKQFRAACKALSIRFREIIDKDLFTPEEFQHFFGDLRNDIFTHSNSMAKLSNAILVKELAPK